MIRFTREETAEYLRCSMYALRRMEREKLFEPGDYYNIGNRRLYVKRKLDEWSLRGGEDAARERKKNERNGTYEKQIQKADAESW